MFFAPFALFIVFFRQIKSNWKTFEMYYAIQMFKELKCNKYVCITKALLGMQTPIQWSGGMICEPRDARKGFMSTRI